MRRTGGFSFACRPHSTRLAAGDLADRADLRLGPAATLAVQRLDQRAVLLEDVVGLQRRGLVEHLVRGPDARMARLGDGHARPTLPLPPASTSRLSAPATDDEGRATVAYTVTFIRGDGTGPELAEATARVLEATGVEFEWDWQDAGADVYEAEGTPMPDRVLESIRRNKIAIKAPITTPVGSGFRSVNVALRKELDLYCCLRPCKAYKGVRTRFPETDIVIVRENHEDLYAGIEFERAREEAAKLREAIKELSGKEIREDAGISIKPISVFGTTQDRALGVRVRARQRPPQGDRRAQGEHHEVLGRPVPAHRPGGREGVLRTSSSRTASSTTCATSSSPARRSTTSIVLPNLYGDIVSDLGAGMIGGLGMAPGGNIGDEYAVFEATHGSAPKYKGMNKVNPMALMLSGVMMLRHLGEHEAANRDGVGDRRGDRGGQVGHL